jgi:hypothetical protein
MGLMLQRLSRYKKIQLYVKVNLLTKAEVGHKSTHGASANRDLGPIFIHSTGLVYIARADSNIGPSNYLPD